MGWIEHAHFSPAFACGTGIRSSVQRLRGGRARSEQAARTRQEMKSGRRGAGADGRSMLCIPSPSPLPLPSTPLLHLPLVPLVRSGEALLWSSSRGREGGCCGMPPARCSHESWMGGEEGSEGLIRVKQILEVSRGASIPPFPSRKPPAFIPILYLPLPSCPPSLSDQPSILSHIYLPFAILPPLPSSPPRPPPTSPSSPRLP